MAGGSGTRMGADIPKQFLNIAGKPVLMHTLEKFLSFDASIQIVLVLPFQHIETWNRLCGEHRFIIPHRLAMGGNERFISVKNGLVKISDHGLTAIHDGVRPLVSEQVIGNCFRAAAECGGAIPVISPGESLRKLEGDISIPVDRKMYRLVQTPQVFKTSFIKKAYDREYESRFTDDATVFEAAGYTVRMVEGNPENIKITHPQDLMLANYLLKL